MNPRKKPKFIRQSGHAYVRLGNKWRHPRGTHSKLKIKQKGKGFIPNPGYGAPRALRYKHPSGLYEILIHNLQELQGIDAKTYAGRIASGVGTRKKNEIMKKAEEMKIRILNPPKVAAKVPKQKGVKEDKKEKKGKEAK